MRTRIAVVLLAATVVLLASCGSSSDDGTVSSDRTVTTSTTTTTSGATDDLPSTTASSSSDATKPTVTVPDGDPPTELQTKDLVVGTGAEAVAGSPVTVHYVGVAWSTGKEFDNSWDRGVTFDFTLGTGQVIAGWDEGVAGMKVGGRREIVIPPDKGYGAEGVSPAIGPNETLVFVVDLITVG